MAYLRASVDSRSLVGRPRPYIRMACLLVCSRLLLACIRVTCLLIVLRRACLIGSMFMTSWLAYLHSNTSLAILFAYLPAYIIVFT